MTIKRFIEFPLSSVYRSLVFALVLFAGVAGGAPKHDSIKLAALSARVDSLTQVLRDSKLAAEYAKEGVQAVKDGNKAFKDANDKVTTQFLAFVGGMITLLLTGFGTIGFFIYKRTKDERDFVAAQVRDMVTPELEKTLADIRTITNKTDGDFRTHQRGYNTFANEREKKSNADDEMFASLTKLIEAHSVGIRDNSKIHQISETLAISRECDTLEAISKIVPDQNHYCSEFSEAKEIHRLILPSIA